MDDFLGDWEPDGSSEEAWLERLWDKKNPLADKTSEEDLKARLRNLTAYGAALGLFQAEPPKDQWEPQNSEEEETMRHGRFQSTSVHFSGHGVG